jgi:hypothetical protein
VQFIYSDGTIGQTEEAVPSSASGQKEKEKERDKGREKWKNKEKGKKEGVSISTPFLALSRGMKFGSNSTRDRSFKLMSGRSIGLLSNRSGSELSHSSAGMLSHRSVTKDCDGVEDGSEDGVEDATRCLYQQRALRNGIEGACSVEQWQRPLIAVREYYISFPPPAFEPSPKRISITNLMTSLVDSPKKPLIKPLSRAKLEAQTRAPSSYCVIS